MTKFVYFKDSLTNADVPVSIDDRPEITILPGSVKLTLKSGRYIIVKESEAYIRFRLDILHQAST